jgi:UDP-N-acetylmuramyl pentapeptide synthase
VDGRGDVAPVDWAVVTPTASGSAPRPAGNRPVPIADLTDLTGTPVQGDASVAVTGVTLASAAVRPGDLYAALPGARTHGAAYVPEALARGAVRATTQTVTAGSRTPVRCSARSPAACTAGPASS